MLPGAAVLTLAGGFLFGWFWGALASVAAATTGAIVIFLIARSALGEAVATLSDPVDPDFVRDFQLIYPDAGHALHWEEPKRFAADLAAFVARAVARDRFAA